jgi:hypothetical protein
MFNSSSFVGSLHSVKTVVTPVVRAELPLSSLFLSNSFILYQIQKSEFHFVVVIFVLQSDSEIRVSYRLCARTLQL